MSKPDRQTIEFISQEEMNSLKRQAKILRIKKSGGKFDGLGLPKYFRDPVKTSKTKTLKGKKMIEIKNNTASLGLEAGDTFESVEEMRSIVSDWLLEGGMEDAEKREEYIDRWMKEVSYEEVEDEEGEDPVDGEYFCKNCERDTLHERSRCPLCGEYSE